jgi:uncharacterized protein YktA (UPF0223 family)
MAKISIKDIKSHLNQKPSDALLEEILTLIKTFPQVREYYQAQLLPGDSTEILAKYKKIIENEFFPSRGFGKLRLASIRKAISDYKKLSPSVEGRVELLLCFVGQGSKFINEYGDIKENFYISMESAYKEACELIASKELEKKWESQFEEVAKTSKNSGYSFGDNITDMFNETFLRFN